MQHHNVVDLHAYSKTKSSGLTQPLVTSRIRNDTGKLGSLSPVTYRDTVAWSTPINSANSACESPLRSRKAESRIDIGYHSGIEKQDRRGIEKQDVYDGTITVDALTNVVYHPGIKKKQGGRLMANPIKELREAAEVTQPQLADRIGAHQSQLSRWEKEPGEKGYRPIPLSWAKKIAAELNVDVAIIHSGDADDDAPLPGPLKSRQPDVDQELQYAVGILMGQSQELKRKMVYTILEEVVAAREARSKKSA